MPYAPNFSTLKDIAADNQTSANAARKIRVFNDPRHQPMRLHPWSIALALCVPLLAATPLSADGLLQRQCRTIIQQQDLRKTRVSLFALDLTNDSILVRIKPDQRMIPASNMKLITTAAALKILGGSFAFRTELRLVETVGPLPNSAGNGHLAIIVGDGDPALGDSDLLMTYQQMDVNQMLDRWVDAFRKAGVRHVVRLTVDDRVFDRQWVHPDWPIDQLNRWYCAQVAGVNLHENCVYVYPTPTTLGHSPSVILQPHVQFIADMSRNRAITNKRDTFWISRKLNTNELTFRGNVRYQRMKPVKATVHDPPLFMAKLLAERLQTAGITVDQIDRAGPEEQFVPSQVILKSITPLRDVIRRCNKDSQNLFAEALLKRVGRHVTGAPGSWETGSAAMRIFLQNHLGPTASVVNISDGGGMSRNNRITSRIIVQILRLMYHDTDLGEIFKQSLSIGGVDGTLRRRLSDQLSGTVLAKSGFINGVSTLSGYHVFNGGSDDQRVVAFSFLFNDIVPPVYVYDIKKLQDELILMIDRHYAGASKSVRLGS